MSDDIHSQSSFKTVIGHDGVKLEEPVVKVEDGPIATKVEETVAEAVVSVVPASVPPLLKEDVEKIVKDVVKLAIKELLDEMKKSPLGALDKDGDGVISAAEVKEAAVAQVAKLGCGAPSCTIS